jgi:hypothetical protein
VKEKQDGTKCPKVVTRQGPASVEEVEQNMTVNLPGGQARRPSVSTLDLDL